MILAILTITLSWHWAVIIAAALLIVGMVIGAVLALNDQSRGDDY